jgi:hypothetical protein
MGIHGLGKAIGQAQAEDQADFKQGVLNHEEQVKQLAKTCSGIADLLPTVQLSIILYPTEPMQEAVAQLYASLINFLIRAVKWYRQGRLAHAWASVTRPWTLSWKDYAEDIANCSRRVDRLAHQACFAELRDAHLDIHSIRTELSSARVQINRLVELAITNQSVQSQLQLDVSSHRTAIARVELNQLLSQPFMSHLPTSGECLNYCVSMRERRRHRSNLILPNIGQLERWADQPKSSFMFIDSHIGNTAQDFIADLVCLVRQSKFPIIWALRFSDFWERPITSIDLLRMLVIQALQINPDVMTDAKYPISLTQLREASNEEDWLSILNRALTGIRQIYVVIDAALLGYVTDQSKYAATKWLLRLPSRITGSTVKIFVSTFAVDQGYVTSNWDLLGWTKLQIDGPGCPSKTRLKRRAGTRRQEKRSHRKRAR